MEHTRRDVFGLATAVGVGAGAMSLAAPAKAAGFCSDALLFELGPEPASPPLREGTVRSGTADIWYWDTGGTGPAVVLVHPASGSGKIWRYQQQPFVDAGFRLIGYSRRGADGSSRGEPGDATSALDDLRAVLVQLKVDRFHVLGSAAGTSVAIAMALAEPQRVMSLVLSTSMIQMPPKGSDASSETMYSSDLSKLPLELRELSPSYRVANPAGMARWVELSQGRADAMSESSGPPSGPGGPGGRRFGGPGGPMGMGTDLGKIAVPTLLIAGEADLHAPPPVMAAVARQIPRARLLTMPACGHSGYWEMPRVFNSMVIDFCRDPAARG